MPLALENVSRAVPPQNTAGTGNHILVVERADVTALPAPADTDLTTAGSIPAASITLASGKSWKLIELTLDEGEVKSDPIGGRDHGTFRNTATVSTARNNAQKVGLANYIINKDVIVLVPERGLGQYRVMGTLADPAHIKPASDSGNGPESKNQARFVIESIGPMAPYVSGTVTIGG
ncbi:hypothetical protein [Microcystis phage Mae-Yong924-2]|nr:hypothetical protein [Microcystis phage Mea-Yong924-1]QYC50730.1 hypothetical protein [Microcystis phage Mae-Yong924-2]